MPWRIAILRNKAPTHSPSLPTTRSRPRQCSAHTAESSSTAIACRWHAASAVSSACSRFIRSMVCTFWSLRLQSVLRVLAGPAAAIVIAGIGDFRVKRIVGLVVPAVAAFVRFCVAPAAALGGLFLGHGFIGQGFLVRLVPAPGVLAAAGAAFRITAGCRPFRLVSIGHLASPVDDRRPCLVYSNGDGNGVSRPPPPSRGSDGSAGHGLTPSDGPSAAG